MLQDPIPVHLIAQPFTLIHVSSVEFHHAVALPVVIDEVTLVAIAVGIVEGAVAVLEAEVPLASVGLSVGIHHLSEPVWLVLFPLTLVRVAIRVVNSANS